MYPDSYSLYFMIYNNLINDINYNDQSWDFIALNVVTHYMFNQKVKIHT